VREDEYGTMYCAMETVQERRHISIITVSREGLMFYP